MSRPKRKRQQGVKETGRIRQLLGLQGLLKLRTLGAEAFAKQPQQREQPEATDARRRSNRQATAAARAAELPEATDARRRSDRQAPAAATEAELPEVLDDRR